jgi:phage terminase large subunit-like protein
VLRALRGLRHTKGKWAGVALDPDEWQIEWLIKPLFGWKHPDGTRVIRTAWIEIPRKNGKSTIASGFAIVLLAADGEQGAEVYSAAGSKEQARIVFEEAKKMAQASPALRRRVRTYKDAIVYSPTGGAYKVLSSAAEVAHGLNVSGGVVDEVHTFKSRNLVDAIETGTGAREQPLIIFITTADEGDEQSIYAEKHNYAIKVAEGVVQDPTFYAAIWAAEEKDDPFVEATWRKANPGLGTTVKLEYLRKEAERARTTPTYFATFMRLHLNRRVHGATRFIPLAKWDQRANVQLIREGEFEGKPCYAGMDLSSTTDLTALVLLFPRDDGRKTVLPFFWMPKNNLAERQRQDRVPYETWERMGLLTATEGDVVDYQAVRLKLNELGKRHEIREVAYDPWNATQLSLELQDDGFTCIPMRQGFASLSAPTKDLLAHILAGRWHHGGNPILRWMAANLVVVTDAAGNVKPNKAKSTGRIDGLAAAINALDRAARNEGGPSALDLRGGLLTFG